MNQYPDEAENVSPLSHKPQVLFSMNVEINVDKLPAWRPNIVVDSYFFEDDDEL